MDVPTKYPYWELIIYICLMGNFRIFLHISNLFITLKNPKLQEKNTEQLVDQNLLDGTGIYKNYYNSEQTLLLKITSPFPQHNSLSSIKKGWNPWGILPKSLFSKDAFQHSEIENKLPVIDSEMGKKKEKSLDLHLQQPMGNSLTWCNLTTLY